MYGTSKNPYGKINEKDLYTEVEKKVENLKKEKYVSRGTVVEKYLLHFHAAFDTLQEVLKQKQNITFENKEAARKANIKNNVLSVMNRLKNSKTNEEIHESVLNSPKPEESSSEKKENPAEVKSSENMEMIDKIKEKIEEGIALCICIFVNDLTRIMRRHDINGANRKFIFPDIPEYFESDDSNSVDEAYDADDSRTSIESEQAQYKVEDYTIYFNLYYLFICYSYLTNCKKDPYYLFVALLLVCMIIDQFKDYVSVYDIRYMNTKKHISCCCTLIAAMICCRLGVLFKEEKKFCASLFFLSYSYIFALIVWQERKAALMEDLLSLFFVNVQELTQLMKNFNFPRIHNFLFFKGIDHLVHSMEWGIKKYVMLTEEQYTNETLIRTDGTDTTLIYMSKEQVEAAKEEMARIILNMYISMEDYMETCEKYFVSSHMLSTYEQMLLMGLYISKDVHRLCSDCNLKKEKKFMKERIHRWYRNLLEVYLMYMKYNHMNHLEDHVEYLEECYKDLWEEYYVHEATQSISGIGELMLEIERNALRRKSGLHMSEFAELTDEEEFKFKNKQEEEEKENRIRYMKHLEKKYLEERISVDMKNILNKQMKEFQIRNKSVDYDKIKFFDKNLAYEAFIQFLKVNTVELYTGGEDGQEKRPYNYADDFECTLSFKIFLRTYLTKIDGVTWEITKILEEYDIKRALHLRLDLQMTENFINLFTYGTLRIENRYVQIYEYTNDYKDKVDTKLKEQYTKLYTVKSTRDFNPLLYEKNKKEEPIEMLYLTYVHYLCYNSKQMETLFQIAQKYFKKSIEYFSLYKQTTLYLDIVLNSSPRYMYLNFFTEDLNLYKSNLAECMQMLLYPVDHLQHSQYDHYKKALIDEATEVAQELFICSKLGVCLKSLYYPDYYKNTEKYLLDSILVKHDYNSLYTLNDELKKKLFTIINLHSKYLKCFRKKENSDELIFSDNDEALKYFYTYLHICHLLQHINKKDHMEMAFNHYTLIHKYLTFFPSALKDNNREAIITICNEQIEYLKTLLAQIN